MKPILRDATAFVLDDPVIGGQALVVTSREGCLILVAPGEMVRYASITELRGYFEKPAVRLAAPELSDIVLAELAKLEAQ